LKERTKTIKDLDIKDPDLDNVLDELIDIIGEKQFPEYFKESKYYKNKNLKSNQSKNVKSTTELTNVFKNMRNNNNYECFKCTKDS
jgi:hypothetical protein